MLSDYLNYKKMYDLMNQRQSIRNFSEPALREEIEKIIHAGITAPSAFNSQPWKFVVVESQEMKKKIREAYSDLRKKHNWYEQDTSFIERCTPVLVVSEDDSEMNIVSCSLAIQNMFLSAESLGLGSLPVGAFQMNKEDEKELLDLCEVEKGKLVLLCLFGKKDEKPERKTRKAIEEVVEFR